VRPDPLILCGVRQKRHVGTSERHAQGVLKELKRMLAANDPVLLAQARTRKIEIEPYFETEYLDWARTQKSERSNERDQSICKSFSGWLTGHGLAHLVDIRRGCSSPAMTQKYAHMAPEDLHGAVGLLPWSEAVG